MHLSSYFRLQLWSFIRSRVRKPCGVLGFGISTEHGASCPAAGNLLWREYESSTEQTVLGRLEQQGE